MRHNPADPALAVARVDVVYGSPGLFSLAILATQGKETHFAFFDARGELPHAAIVDELSQSVPECRDLIAWRPDADLARQRAAFLAERRREYLSRLADDLQWIDLGGLAPQIGGELLRLPLDTMFVHLHAERDVPVAEDFTREELRLRRELESQGAPADRVARELEDLAARLAREQAEASGRRERVHVFDALQNQRVAVLGDPGAGKTTLLRFVARALATAPAAPVGPAEPAGLPAVLGADLFPVYVRLGEYAQYCERRGAVSLLEFMPLAARSREWPLAPELLDAEVAAGRCVFLLDGLDEIVHPGRRKEIRDRLQELAAAHPQCRAIVTSRIVGYREVQLPAGEDGFAHFTLSPFDDDEIACFARQWYAAIEAKGKILDRERQNAQVLTDAIQANPSVRRLAANPLLMTLIALIYWREVRLPRRRVELYRLASQTLLAKWVQANRPGVEISEREATSLLMAVAFHVHETSGAGVIPRPELERLLIAEKMRRGGLPELQAEKEVEDFLRVMGEHVGILYPRGYDDRHHEVFGFLHLTFEEYFAGRELARRWKQGTVQLRDYLHRPRWEEPFRLAAAHLSDEDDETLAERFVREVFEAGSPFEKECHRDLLLAARCLGDDVRVSPELVDAIFSGLDAAFVTSIVPLNEQIRDVVRHDARQPGGAASR